MNRYIDEDALKTEIDKSIFDADDKEWYLTLLENVPSIDIESNQGEWIVDEGGWKVLDYYPPKCKCNQCGYEEELYLIHAKPTNFCPNCGADMRGVDDGRTAD